jgi:hypothetical protein
MKAPNGELAKYEDRDVTDIGTPGEFAASVRAVVYNNLSQRLCDQHSHTDRLRNITLAYPLILPSLQREWAVPVANLIWLAVDRESGNPVVG